MHLPIYYVQCYSNISHVTYTARSAGGDDTHSTYRTLHIVNIPARSAGGGSSSLCGRSHISAICESAKALSHIGGQSPLQYF